MPLHTAMRHSPNLSVAFPDQTPPTILGASRHPSLGDYKTGQNSYLFTVRKVCCFTELQIGHT